MSKWRRLEGVGCVRCGGVLEARYKPTGDGIVIDGLTPLEYRHAPDAGATCAYPFDVRPYSDWSASRAFDRAVETEGAA